MAVAAPSITYPPKRATAAPVKSLKLGGSGQAKMPTTALRPEPPPPAGPPRQPLERRPPGREISMTDAGSLTYVLTDIHGRADLLTRALTMVAEHAGRRSHRLVFLGDYIDRGPASAEVVECVMGLQASRPPGVVVCLRGNHEQLCLDALAIGGGWRLALWLRNGGDATLASYSPIGEEPALHHIPAAHRAWLIERPFIHQDQHRIYVHAGLRPNTPLIEQGPETCLWIRGPFLEALPGEFPAHVVHGHTPVWKGKPMMAAPEQLAHRTNLDTGAFMTGVLTVGVFRDAQPGGPSDLLIAS
jgi:serine/threonine protein phosphatase 1